MALVQYKSRDFSKYDIVAGLRNSIVRNKNTHYFSACSSKFKFLTYNKILVKPDIRSLYDRASIIDFDLTTNYFDMYNSNIPTLQEIAKKFGITPDHTHVRFNMHGVHDDRVCIGYILTDVDPNSSYYWFMAIYDFVKDQLIDVFEVDRCISTQCQMTYYNDKMRYFIYVNGNGLIKIRDVNKNINLNYEWPYTNIVVADNKASYLYMVYNMDNSVTLKIIAVSLTTLKSDAFEIADIYASIDKITRVSFKENYLIFGDRFHWYAIYMNGVRIAEPKKINKIIRSGMDTFVKIQNGILYVVDHSYGVYNIQSNFMDSYSFSCDNKILYGFVYGGRLTSDILDLIGTRLYMSLDRSGDFCVVIGKIFHGRHCLQKFFKKNKSKFGNLIHSNCFEINLLDLIVSYI